MPNIYLLSEKHSRVESFIISKHQHFAKRSWQKSFASPGILKNDSYQHKRKHAHASKHTTTVRPWSCAVGCFRETVSDTPTRPSWTRLGPSPTRPPGPQALRPGLPTGTHGGASVADADDATSRAAAPFGDALSRLSVAVACGALCVWRRAPRAAAPDDQVRVDAKDLLRNVSVSTSNDSAFDFFFNIDCSYFETWLFKIVFTNGTRRCNFFQSYVCLCIAASVDVAP